MTEHERKQLLRLLRALEYTEHNWSRMGVLCSSELDGAKRIIKDMLEPGLPKRVKIDIAPEPERAIPQRPLEKPDEPNPYG